MEPPKISSPTIIHVKVIPKSAENEFVGLMDDGTWKIRIAEEAKDGKANAELLSFLHGITGRKANILRGHTSPRKVIEFL